MSSRQGSRLLRLPPLIPKPMDTPKGHPPPSARLVDGLEEAAEGARALCLATECEVDPESWLFRTFGESPNVAYRSAVTRRVGCCRRSFLLSLT